MGWSWTTGVVFTYENCRRPLRTYKGVMVILNRYLLIFNNSITVYISIKQLIITQSSKMVIIVWKGGFGRNNIEPIYYLMFHNIIEAIIKLSFSLSLVKM